MPKSLEFQKWNLATVWGATIMSLFDNSRRIAMSRLTEVHTDSVTECKLMHVWVFSQRQVFLASPTIIFCRLLRHNFWHVSVLSKLLNTAMIFTK